MLQTAINDSYHAQIVKLYEKIQDAEAIVIGCASGMSAAAG